ncbi:unnamed protein product [Symbiodinium natans]|uniref:Uncharacterized protein n=1 Tax=Symbiodinium natans TaxID=878477 RepID=A0A812LDG2_9DINO|nr:unnamed protein product [Symbiodinium natans]
MAPGCKASVLRNDAKGRRAWMVWCFEHCRKMANQSMYTDMAQIAQECGLELIYHKKCEGFLRWLDGLDAGDTVLLVADWREAKPIVEGLRRRLFPYLWMCVLTQSQASYFHASSWAASHPCGREIPVLAELNKELLHAAAGNMAQAVEDAEAAKLAPQVIEWPLNLSTLSDPKIRAELAVRLQEVIEQSQWEVYED